MNKKGFTLIELLAVIVILAIIALIAVPSVLNIIEDSKKAAAEANARNIASTAKTYYMAQIMQDNTTKIINLSAGTLKYDGEQASKGYVTFTDGTPKGKMYISGYCVEIKLDGTVTSEKVEEDECKIILPIVYSDGTPLYFNPTTGLKCNSNEAASSVGRKSGCMKWYTFLDSEDSETVNLILAHNTTAYIAWNSDKNGTTPDTVNEKLQLDTAGWKQTINGTSTAINARLISAEEVNQIAPTNPNFNVNEINTYYFFHTGTQSSYRGAVGTNKYAWLFDNTIYCADYGCNVEDDSGAHGYWTSSFASSGRAWYVAVTGCLYHELVFYPYSTGCGIRPVITISKSIFE